MEENTFKRSIKLGEDEIAAYVIFDYRMRRPEFDSKWGIELVLNDDTYLFAGAYDDDALVMSALKGICSMFAALQSLEGLEPDDDLTHFIYTWIAPRNELDDSWLVLPGLTDEDMNEDDEW